MKNISVLIALLVLGACEKEETPLKEYCECSETRLDTGEVLFETLTEGACNPEYDETITTFDFGELRYVCKTIEK